MHKTLSEAVAAGAAVYSTGKPCVRGHMAERSVKNRACAQCKRDDQQRWRVENPEKSKEANREFFRKNPGRYRAKQEAGRLQRRYGLTADDIARMAAEQGIRCAICSDPFEKTPHVDHCHATGKVRALLCTHCNRGLGGARDSVAVLQSMIKYLRKHAA